MNTFSLSVPCVTCGRTLRITDPALIGTIATCPACGSMVQVPDDDRVSTSDTSRVGSNGDESDNAERLAIGDAAVDSAAVTEESILAEGVLSGAPPPSGFAGDSPPSNQPPPATTAPGLDWQSNQSQNAKKIGLMIATALVVIVSLSLGIVAWIRRDGGDPIAISDPKGPEPAAPSDLDPSADLEDARPEDDLAASVPPDASPPSDDEAMPPDSVAIDDPTGDEPLAVDPSATAPTPVPATATAPAATPGFDTGLSPLMPEPILGSRLPGPAADPESAKGADEDGPTMEVIPEGLLPFTPFVLNESPKPQTTLDTPPSMDDIRIKEAAQNDDPLKPAKDRTIRPQTDLAMSMAMKTEAYPVTDLLLVLSSLTDVPIEIDLTSFDMAGIPISEDFSPESTNAKPVIEWLREIAESIRGQLRFEPTLGVIEPKSELFDAAIVSLIDRSDLADSTRSLQAFLGIDAEDDRLFSDAADKTDRILAALACESFRRMRNIEGKIEDQRLARWAQSLEYPVPGWSVLSGVTMTGQSDTPISVARFLQSVGRHADGSVLVNWKDFTRQGLGSAEKVFPDIDQAPTTAISRTLDPLKVQVRKVDDRFLWVGSEATYDRLPILVWSRPLGTDRDTFEARFRVATAGVPPESVRYTFDATSDRALMMVPRYIRRQMNKVMAVIANVQ